MHALVGKGIQLLMPFEGVEQLARAARTGRADLVSDITAAVSRAAPDLRRQFEQANGNLIVGTSGEAGAPPQSADSIEVRPARKGRVRIFPEGAAEHFIFKQRSYHQPGIFALTLKNAYISIDTANQASQSSTSSRSTAYISGASAMACHRSELQTR